MTTGKAFSCLFQAFKKLFTSPGLVSLLCTKIPSTPALAYSFALSRASSSPQPAINDSNLAITTKSGSV